MVECLGWCRSLVDGFGVNDDIVDVLTVSYCLTNASIRVDEAQVF